MSEHLLKILLTELQTVRLRCKRKGCGGVVEVPLHRLEAASGAKCPACKHELLGPSAGEDNPLALLSQAMRSAADLKNFVEVEFVLPVEDKL